MHRDAISAGKKFHLAFMENTVEYPIDGPLEVFVSNTGDLLANVTVSAPRDRCPSVTAIVPANSNVMIGVCWWMKLLAGDYWPSYRTVLVESDRDVMVYGNNKERFSADGFYAIPSSQLAFSYIVAAFGAANIATQFAISSTQAFTTVQISLPHAEMVPVQINYHGLVYTNGDTFTILLDEYETYLGQSRGDLTGTKILANASIAVFSGNVRNLGDGSSRDHLVAQLRPVDDWGSRFIMAPVPRINNFGDIVRIIAKSPNTEFTMRCSESPDVTQVLSSPGSFHETEITSTCFLSSNKQLQVVQMVKSQEAPRINDVADPAMFLLVPQKGWLNDYLSPSPVTASSNLPYRKNFAFIAIADGQEAGLRINGFSVNPLWTTINGIASAWVAVNAGSNRFTHSNNQVFNVMVYGASDRESYGFALGANYGIIGCREILMTRGDGIDNDCDGDVDEEACNLVDDDNDGYIDEDCRRAAVEAVGIEYALIFMENNVDDSVNPTAALEIYLSAAEPDLQVNYTLENKDGTFYGTINPNDVDIFTNLSVDLRHTGSGVSHNSIRIVANSDIVVYGINKQTFSTDGFLVFPVDVVGTEYYTAHYFPGEDKNEFAFTPAYNDGGDTMVRVTMPRCNYSDNQVGSCSASFGSQTIAAEEFIDVTLEYGMTAQFQSATTDDNLNGAHIISNKPISVFSGNVRARVDPTDDISSRDHLVQQLAPVTTWGQEFVTVPIPRSDDKGDVFIVTASVLNTHLQVKVQTKDQFVSSRTEVLPYAGSTVKLDGGSDEYMHLIADHPVQVFQYVKTTANKVEELADPAMLMIPPVAQWSRDYQFITPRTGQKDDENGGFLPFETFILIVINSTYRNDLRFDDGAPPPSAPWVDILGSSILASELEDASSVRHILAHTEPSVFYQAILYGRADRESYALPIAPHQCVSTLPAVGDGVDNDCDGSIDEELCNEIDDDVDGKVDEDCGVGLSSGTAFFFTYMENTVEYEQGFDLELYVAVVGNQKATVNVKVPLETDPVYDLVTEIQPVDVQAYGLVPKLRNVGQGIFSTTVFVRSNKDIVVYGVNKEKFSNDAFLVYPESSLGTDHYTCHWSPSTLPTEFAVVATQSNTEVNVTLPRNRADIAVLANGQTYTSGDSFTIFLERFQVYQGQSVGDLTGTRIQSNIRVAVFAGNVRTNVELSASRDHLVQQMLPIGSYGMEFSVVPFPSRTVGDVLKIVAGFPDTEIRVNGVVLTTLTEAGDHTQYQLSSTSSISVTSTRPITVLQFVKSQSHRDSPETADPAMFLVPSSRNLIIVASFITPVYSGGRTPGEDYTNYVTLVIEDGHQDEVRLNGEVLPLDVSWTAIPSTTQVTATFTVSSGSSHTITTTTLTSFYGRLYGHADRESYAFPVGFRFN
ncbi:uncharacterized protein [Watersipora subatra]|uniref:uncharacterized protein n=1 Tax=Watersipora subatra TaxID=2589382 RepID=UPI00355B832F